VQQQQLLAVFVVIVVKGIRFMIAIRYNQLLMIAIFTIKLSTPAQLLILFTQASREHCEYHHLP